MSTLRRILTTAGVGIILAGQVQAYPDCRLCPLGLDWLAPQIDGSLLSLEYGLVDQDRNWSGTASASAADNTDKQICDEYIMASIQAAFSPMLHLEIDVPFADRLFTTDANGPAETFRHSGFGDVQTTVHYSGLLKDGSLELVFGLKLPTGETGYTGFPGDMQIGTGSTDLVVGLSYRDEFAEDWMWTGEIAWSQPFAGSHRFKPGSAIKTAAGLSYGGQAFGEVRVTPFLQVSALNVAKDAGIDADPDNAGGSRIALSPGIELAFRGWSLSGEVAFPVYRCLRGNQLAARREFKLMLSYALDGGRS